MYIFNMGYHQLVLEARTVYNTELRVSYIIIICLSDQTLLSGKELGLLGFTQIINAGSESMNRLSHITPIQHYKLGKGFEVRCLIVVCTSLRLSDISHSPRSPLD